MQCKGLVYVAFYLLFHTWTLIFMVLQGFRFWKSLSTFVAHKNVMSFLMATFQNFVFTCMRRQMSHQMCLPFIGLPTNVTFNFIGIVFHVIIKVCWFTTIFIQMFSTVTRELMLLSLVVIYRFDNKFDILSSRKRFFYCYYLKWKYTLATTGHITKSAPAVTSTFVSYSTFSMLRNSKSEKFCSLNSAVSGAVFVDSVGSGLGSDVALKNFVRMSWDRSQFFRKALMLNRFVMHSVHICWGSPSSLDILYWK